MGAIPDVFDGGILIPLVDETNLAADTYYYPSEDGQTMDGFDDLSVGYALSGGVTLTVEAYQIATPVWVDITLAGSNLNTNTTGNASFVDVTGIVDFDNLNAARFRIKVVTSDNTNSVAASARIKSVDR